MATPDIKVGSKFDAKGFKQAETALTKLTKTAKKAGAAFGVVFSAQTVTRYASSAVRAFAAEERQIQQLTNTVNNLGLAFAAPAVNAYIADLERLTGISRDQLQPAFQTLLTQTGSITIAQEIFSAALEASSSGVVSLEEATSALTGAYVGNVKGLQKFKLGLSNAELQTKTFNQILELVKKTYDGQFKSAMESSAAKIGKVEIAAKNAKVAVGEGLVDAFSNLAGDGNIDKANAKLEKFGRTLGDVLRSVTSEGFKSLIDFLNPATTGGFNNPNKNPFGANLGSPASWRANNAKIVAEQKKAADLLKKKEEEKLKVLRQQAAEKRAQNALDKANLALSNAQNVFDMERIQVAAASQNATLTENERKRLEIKQAIFNLEDAIDSKDTVRIEKASAILNGLVAQFGVLQNQQKMIDQINTAVNVLGTNKDIINLLNLQAAYDLLLKMSKIVINPLTGGNTTGNITATGGNTTGITANSTFNPGGFRWIDEGNTGNVTGLPGTITATSGWDPSFFRKTDNSNMPTVIVQITDNAQKLVDAVTFATQNNSANGTPVALSRNATNLAW